MARPWRIEFEDAVYHVTSRGNNRQTIFLDDDDRGFFLICLSRACQRFELDLLAFCLMSNHFHLFLRTPRANLSKAMHWLNGTYTGHFNWRHKRSGHLLQGRYKSVLLADDAHYLQLSMYLHLNPVRAGLVEHPREYFWSSYCDYTGKRPRFSWLNREEILSHYGTRKLSRARDYERECLGLIGQTPGFVEQLKASAILGPRKLIQEIAQKYIPSGKAGDVMSYAQARKREFSLHIELEKVAEIFGMTGKELASTNKRSLGRPAAYYHLVENCGISVTQTSKAMHVCPMAVSIGVKRFKEKVACDKELRTNLKGIMFNV